MSLLASIILLYTRFSGNVEFTESYISKIASPNFVLILFISSIQMLGLGFLGIQNNLLKKNCLKSKG